MGNRGYAQSSSPRVLGMPAGGTRPSQVHHVPYHQTVGSRELLRRQARQSAAAAVPASREASIAQAHQPSTPAMEYREIRMPRTPGAEHREVRSMLTTPAATPSLEHREVRKPRPCGSMVATPSLEHREVRAPRPSSVQVAASPLVQYRAVRAVTQHHSSAASNSQLQGRGNPPVGTQVWNGHCRTSPLVQEARGMQYAAPAGAPVVVSVMQSPVTATRQVSMLQSPVPSNRPVKHVGGTMVDQSYSRDQLDASFHNEGEYMAAAAPLDQLPPVPKNALIDYLKEVQAGYHPLVAGQIEPLDSAKYWDKRQVQAKVRRFLEALQDWAQQPQHRTKLPHEGSPGTGADGGGGADLAGEVFNGLCRILPQEHWRNHPVDGLALEEQAFIDGIDYLVGWPSDLTQADREEVFFACLVPSLKTVRRIREGREPVPGVLTRSLLSEGLARVPFGLPDFPVPVHLLKASTPSFGVKEVTKDLAHRFASKEGYDQLKDFYMTGLITMEELQISLPYLPPVSMLEQAAETIIRAAAKHLTHVEWQRYVYNLTGKPNEAAPPSDTPPPPASPPMQFAEAPCLASPPMQHRPCAAGTEDASEPEDVSRLPAVPEQKENRCAGVAMTEPLMTREVRSEEPVVFHHRVIDWNTALWAKGSQLRGHQADEGAGVQAKESAVDRQQKAHGLSHPADLPVGDECIRLISLDWHSECLGPFLAHAFIRCCEIYKDQLLRGSPQLDDR
eukprot:TRINITY_DN22650_c0_g1_i1.p1 TRINITY_DN22650_c0_g1~~TRINITY_DN22650_c0_g1_i1.p1  ORF type:complete len:799 (+),score=137.88 TRINITY_DN22650_c0_g1_i1:207-2399(+)